MSKTISVRSFKTKVRPYDYNRTSNYCVKELYSSKKQSLCAYAIEFDKDVISAPVVGWGQLVQFPNSIEEKFNTLIQEFYTKPKDQSGNPSWETLNNLKSFSNALSPVLSKLIEIENINVQINGSISVEFGFEDIYCFVSIGSSYLNFYIKEGEGILSQGEKVSFASQAESNVQMLVQYLLGLYYSKASLDLHFPSDKIIGFDFG